MLEGFLVLGGLALIFGLLVKDVVHFRTTGSFKKRSSPTGAWHVFLLGLVTIAAIAGLADRGSVGLGALTPIGLGVGVLAALMSRFAALGSVGEWGMSGIGLIAAVPSVAQLMSGKTACTTSTPTVGVIGSGVLLAIVFALAAVAASFAGRGVMPGFGVAVFGGIEVVSYLNTPLGIDLIGNIPLAYAFAVVAAVLLGVCVARFPDLILGLCAAVIFIATLGGGQYCGPGLDYTAAFGAFVGFVVGFFGMVFMLKLVTRSR